MRNLIFVFLFISTTLFSQEFKELNKRTYIGFDVGFGFFGPGDVNDYLNDKYADFYFSSGFPEIVLNYFMDANFTYRFHKNIDIQAFTGFGWAPKVIMIENAGYSDSYHYMRYSYGIIPHLHVPLFINSFFLGIGPIFNHLKFESFQASTLGLKFRAGYNIHGGNFITQVFGGLDYIKGKSDQRYQSRPMTLDYTGFTFGTVFNFPLRSFD